MIGDDVEVKVVMLSETDALIGVTAPRRISVHRKEVYKKCMKIIDQAKVVE